MNWSVLHRESTKFAAAAEEARRRGDPDRAAVLSAQAAQVEVEALAVVGPDKPRTLGVTAVSAAALWYKAGRFAEAEQVARRASAIDGMPAFALNELHDLLGSISREQHTAVQARSVPKQEAGAYHYEVAGDRISYATISPTALDTTHTRNLNGAQRNHSPAKSNPMPAVRVAFARAAGSHRTLVVGRGISVQGIIQDAERLVVEGTVEAALLHAVELQIPQGGVLKGRVEVEDADISGLMDGILTVRGSLVVRETGKVIGKVLCRGLRVEDGGQLLGEITMLTDVTSTGISVPFRSSIETV